MYLRLFVFQRLNTDTLHLERGQQGVYIHIPFGRKVYVYYVGQRPGSW